VLWCVVFGLMEVELVSCCRKSTVLDCVTGCALELLVRERAGNLNFSSWQEI
jgi:hypothetical protein